MGLPPKIIHSNRIFHEINIQKPSMFGSPQFRKLHCQDLRPSRSQASALAPAAISFATTSVLPLQPAAWCSAVSPRFPVIHHSWMGYFMVISWKIPHKCNLGGSHQTRIKSSNGGIPIEWGTLTSWLLRIFWEIDWFLQGSPIQRKPFLSNVMITSGHCVSYKL